MASLSKVPSGVIAPVKRKAAEIIAATGSRVTHVWGASTVPDHNNKRCVDFMVRSIADGNAVADYIWRNRARLGLRLIIWNRRIISTYRSSGGRPAGVWGRYGGPNPHTDHPHVEFNSAAYRAPDGGTAPPVDAGNGPPTPAPTPTPERGLIMGSIKRFGIAKKRTITNKRWATLALNRGGAVSIASGPADVMATVQVQAVIPEGCTLALRFITVDYKKGTKTKIVSVFPAQGEAVHTGGKTYLTVPFLDYIGKASGGKSRRLRVQALATGGNVTLEKNWVRVTTEKR